MYTKTLTYTDFNGQTRTEEFKFNMNEIELMKWAAQPGGYSKDQVIEKMISKEDNEGLLDLTESLLKQSYGEVSLDSKRFIKSPEVQANFFESNAYPVLFLLLATDPAESARFFDEVFPANINETIQKLQAANTARETAAQSAAITAIPTVGEA